MEKNISDFIWQIVVVLLMLSALGVFFHLNQEIDVSKNVVNAQITENRVVIEDTSYVSIDRVSGAEIIFKLSGGADVPMEVNGIYYEIGEIYHHIEIAAHEQYTKELIMNGDGYLQMIKYTRIDG